MKKELLCLGLILVMLASPAHAKKHHKSKKSVVAGPYVVDDFESKTIDKWWVFGAIKPSFMDNDAKEFPFLESNSLRLTGNSDGWIIGGLGTPINVNEQQFNTLKVLMKGIGPNSGSITFELYEGDAKTGEIQADPNNPGYLSVGKRYIYTVKVNWIGWRIVIIPLEWFRNDDPKTRNNVVTPKNGKFVQIQLLGIGAPKSKSMDIMIDRLKFYKEPTP
ncbi:MAG: hypothetical protein EXS67_00065 [Candidatus Margulisbacteria bacterium]|nr:hypothetical protein [Candidatus Margulisiibacteriota bacterium]